MTSAIVTPVMPHNGICLSLEDVKTAFKPDNHVNTYPTAIVSLENTLQGTIMQLIEEVRYISTFARNNEIKMHYDRARLQEAIAARASDFKDQAACFDTVSLCFSKGLGAMGGNI
ncbi:pyridoxal phosphate-dependent transferase [Pseudomassariella vexata]|uniref:Pyridoxal phosphate-dependent transferase n=1 Tax=Pseudomassariella vexata TaxID=1141098 RepID=A0A1Y2DW43_9PEZI|nr:pyridoxal phosphate-dependent transferase [Pseudomassariella vexata]ORY63488.1 pyridoxal phosphate-dependent transferase [Pseudomassariella vexata]